ncbi:MAG: hypothetical protein ACJ8AI_34240 [Rhodopila sp.]
MNALTSLLAFLPLSAVAVGLLALQRQQRDSRQLQFVRVRARRSRR